MTHTTDRSVAYDPTDLEPDPYPAYRRLRERAPVYAGSVAGVDFWALSRFDDVQAAARDWETFSSAEGNDLDDTGRLYGPAPVLDATDPPAHTRHRGVLRAAFSLRAVRALEPAVRRKVRSLLAPLREREHVDFAAELAYPLPAATICGLLGLPESDLAQLRRWHAAMLERIPGSLELPCRARRARAEMGEYVDAALRARCGRDRGDLLSALAAAERAGALSHEEAVAMAFFLYDAGIVSTSALIASAILHLRAFPAERARLRHDPSLAPAAVEELLRYDAPFQWQTRVTARAVEMRGVRIPAGARVVLVWGSANRDERRWADPDRLVLTRAPQRHLAFSDGIHHCLGAPLARLEARVVLEELIPLLAGYELDAPVRRRVTASERTIVALPVRVEWKR